MAGKDHSLPLRRAIVSALRNDAAVAAEVGSHVYGADLPSDLASNHVSVGHIIAAPFEASGDIDGMEATLAVSCQVFENDLRGAETAAYSLGRIVQQALDGKAFALEGDAHVVALDWTSSFTLGGLIYERGARRRVVQFDVLTSDNLP